MNMKSRTKPVEDLQPPRNFGEVAPAAEDVLVEFDRLQSGLRRTHDEIPRLLMRQRELTQLLGEAEVRGDSADGLRAEFDQTVKEREAAVRRRGAAAQAILGLEPQLQSERQRIEAVREKHVTQIAREFQTRYNAAIEILQRLWAEADLLSRRLRTQISTPLPVKVSTSLVTGVATAEPLRGDATAELDAATERLGEHLDALDSALARVAAIKQARQLDQYHHDLSRVRGVAAEFPGTYRVTAAFDCLIDGLKFEAGTLIDSSLLGPGSLQRLVSTRRFIHPAEFETTRAA
jgi:hypothetical protein